jgi:hypothetical protein
MAHLDLYGVTATLSALLSVNIWRLTGQVVKITDLPPEEAEKEAGSLLNLHLYHATEDPNRRNDLPADDLGPYPISRTPLPVILYYALTAHSSANNEINPADQQHLMGLGMKSLHDFPMVDDALRLKGPPVGDDIQILAEPMRNRNNYVRIIARQLTPEDSVSFWAAAQNHTARLTAFYEVRSLLLPPDEAAEKPALVTSYALGVGSAGRPTLFASRSVQTVTLPALSGGVVLTNEMTPAVAAMGAPPASKGDLVTVGGEALGDGTDARIVLGTAGFDALVPPRDEVVIDPAANPAWQFLVRNDALSFAIRPTVFAEAAGGFEEVPIRPGLYGIALRRAKVLTTSNGATSISTASSNLAPFAVGPLITGTAMAGARLRLIVAAGFDCTDDENNVAQISIGGEAYHYVDAFDADPTKNPGTFIAQSATRYEIDLLFDPTDGATRMVRLAVNGVDAPPFWLEP